MAKKIAVPELRVVLDTNILYTSAASHLARLEVVEFIKKHSSYPDLKTVWLLPAIVVEERRYQMLRAALELLPSLTKLEKLLGMNFGLDPSVLDDRIRGAIERDRTSIGLEVASWEPGLVDWHALVAASVHRRAPFEPTKEKGFRDAVVVETFMQEVGRSPKTANLCRLAFVSGDELARQAVTGRASDKPNVRICEDLNQLGGLINTLISSVDETYVAELASQAAKMFYDFTTNTGFYSTANVYNQLASQYKSVIDTLPQGIARADSVGSELAPPQFVSKSSNLLTWTSQLTVKHSLKRLKPPPAPVDFTSGSSPAGLLGVQSGATKMSDFVIQLARPATTNLLGGEYEEVATRRLRFEIKWTTRVSPTRKLSAPKLVGIDHDPD